MPLSSVLGTDLPHKSQHNDTHAPQAVKKAKLIKLISVRLKEAALDSPSFRASTNYQCSLLDQIEQWIDGLIRALRRYPQQYSDFRDVNSVVLGQLIPDLLKFSVVGEETTMNVLKTAKGRLETLWNVGLDDMELNDTEVIELLSQFLKKDIKSYKDIRRNFEYLQSKYDSLLNKFSSQSKTREPSALREDAFQLYEVRQSYLAAAFDICVENSKFQQALDYMLIKFTQLSLQGKSNYDEKYNSKLEAWAKAGSKSTKGLLQDMKQSRAQIEKATALQYAPSRELRDHNIALINVNELIDTHATSPESNEKHAWLYMKTSVGKPSRQVWVRRWVFVKNGIFGLLSLSPSRTFVQETDKIGVLLANIRYAPDEDRRFCFEVKTIDSTIVFQAESLVDLKSWLTVFSVEKQKALDAADSEVGKYAFGRYPPLLQEFASTSLTSVDIELTSTKIENNNNSSESHTLLASTNLSKLIDGSEGTEFQFSSSSVGEFRDPDLNPPMVTARSKLALVAHAFLAPTSIPTAVTANIWGSVNWGIYYMNDSGDSFYGFKQDNFSENNLTSLTKKKNFPPYYPAHLMNYDIQLKSLFEASIDPQELVVAHFTCLWCLNQTQELSGRCFLTVNCAYFYLNSTGFISLSKKPITEFVAVDVMAEKDWEVIKVYGVDGLSMKGRLFMQDGKLLQKKFDLLINNVARTKPKTQAEIIPLIEAMHSEEAAKNTESSVKSSDTDDAPSKKYDELNSFQPFTGVPASGSKMKTNYQNEFELTKVANFRAPAKAVFHILYGDHSSLARDSIALIDTDQFNISPWFKEGEKLTRVLDYKIELSRNMISGFSRHDSSVDNRSIQTVEELVDNKYYRIQEVRDAVQVLGGSRFSAIRKIIIIETDAKSCKVLFYTKFNFTKGKTSRLITKFFSKITKNFQIKEINSLVDQLRHCVAGLGTHGQVIKAIRTYGNLSQSDVDYRPKDDMVFDLTLQMLFKYYVRYWLYCLAKGILNAGHHISDLVSRFVLSVTMNKLLIALLALSVVFNFFLMGRSTYAYWSTKNSAKLVKSVSEQILTTSMDRAISLDDMEILTSFNFNSSSGCFKKFISSLDDGSLHLGELREPRHQIALKRNDLLIQLKILEKVEMELVAGNYKSFVISELNLCKVSFEELQVDNEALSTYCDSCSRDYDSIVNGLLF